MLTHTHTVPPTQPVGSVPLPQPLIDPFSPAYWFVCWNMTEDLPNV